MLPVDSLARVPRPQPTGHSPPRNTPYNPSRRTVWSPTPQPSACWAAALVDYTDDISWYPGKHPREPQPRVLRARNLYPWE